LAVWRFGGSAGISRARLREKAGGSSIGKSYRNRVDIACMEVDTDSGITGFYQKLGFAFLNRPAYFINHGNNEVIDNNVMIMGLRNKNLADKIHTTNHKFHYGKSLGHW